MEVCICKVKYVGYEVWHRSWEKQSEKDMAKDNKANLRDERLERPWQWGRQPIDESPQRCRAANCEHNTMDPPFQADWGED